VEVTIWNPQPNTQLLELHVVSSCN
jgi:hypothetical protein